MSPVNITQALWGTRVSPSVVSELNQKIYGQIEEWRNRPIGGRFAYVYLDGVWLKRSWGGEVKNVSILIAVGVNQDGYREVLAVAEGTKEDKESWTNFLRGLKQRGLGGVKLFVSDKCLGLVESLADFYPEAKWQQCTVHFYRNVWTAVPSGKVKEVAAMLKAIHAQEDLAAAREKAKAVIFKLREMSGGTGHRRHRGDLELHALPPRALAQPADQQPAGASNPRNPATNASGRPFPDGHSAQMLAAARLRHIAGTKWGSKRYLDMSRLHEHPSETQEAVA